MMRRNGLDPEANSLLQPDLSPSKVHKRAVSAPDFALLNATNVPNIAINAEPAQATAVSTQPGK